MNMKTIKLFTLLSILNLLMVACNIQVIVIDGKDNKTGQVEMKVSPDSNEEISFTATANKIIINWGDDSIDEFIPNGVEKEFTHKYSNNILNLKTIVINTENLISISYNDNSISNNDYKKPFFSELRFKDCLNLEEIHFPNNQLTVLEVNNASALKVLYCPNNKLIELNLNECTVLEKINCRSNLITQLTIDRCVILKELICTKNQLNELNVDNFKELEELFCCCNELTKLNLDKNVNLKILECSGNYLTELNVNVCQNIQFINCSVNQLTINKKNELIESLPIFTGDLFVLIGDIEYFEERYGSYEPNHIFCMHGFVLTGLYYTFDNKIKGWVVY